MTDLAESDACHAFEWMREFAPSRAVPWLIGLFEAVFSLAEMPRRCPVISESANLGFEARHLLYGKRTGIHRIVFDINDAVGEVRVLRIWHGSRDEIRLTDLPDESSE